MTSRQIELHAYAILFLLDRTPLTETQIGAKLGYTKANVSHVVRKYKKRHDLRKSRGMKSDDAVESYRESATRVHAKRKNNTNKPCKQQPTKSPFNKFWTSTSDNSQQPTSAPSN